VRDGKSLQATADALTEATGRRWQPTTVARMLARPEYKRDSLAGQAIVSRPVWNDAHAALASRRKRS
jgi:hypothetical protein